MKGTIVKDWGFPQEGEPGTTFPGEMLSDLQTSWATPEPHAQRVGNTCGPNTPSMEKKDV